MAYVNIDRTAGITLADRFSAVIKTLAERNANYRLYRQTINELSALTSRELADLGIHRSTIRSVAREAAYGK